MDDSDQRRRQAEEQLARRFSRLMNATCSPLGVWSDPPIIAVAGAATVVAALLVARFVVTPPPSWALWSLALAPFAVGAGAALAISGARAKVVDWLVSLPFRVENMNGLLNGVGQNLVVRFRGSRPTREELDAALQAVHEDCFALEFHEQDPKPEVEVRIGVLDSKLNPARANYRRYLRVREIVGRALLPLSEQHPIESVRVS
jgi:hypothetical protein